MDNPASPIDSETDNIPQRTSRPASVTILALGVLIITIINLTRLVLSILNWDFLASWPGVSPLYVILTGLIWTIVGALLLWGLWKARKWAYKLTQAVVLTYALYYWLDHVFLMDHPANRAAGAQRVLLPMNWQFAAGATVICLAYTAWTLNRPKVKAYFGLFDSTREPSQMKNDSNG
jgi:hypothetical protein